MSSLFSELKEPKPEKKARPKPPPAQTPDQARDDAIEDVEGGADPEWLIRATRALRHVAKRQEFFTADDVWKELGDYAATREPRALGAVIQKAMKNELIQATDRWVKSVRTECHGRPVRVWTRGAKLS